MKTIRKDNARKDNARRSWAWFVSIFVGLLVTGFIVYPMDLQLAVVLQKIGDLPGDVRRVLALSELIAHGTGVAVILLTIWCLIPRHRLHIPRVAACAFVSGLVATGMKLIHARFRPLACPPDIDEVARTWRGWWPSVNEQLAPNYDYAFQSFPSAHTATAVGFAVGMSWLYPRGKYVFIMLAMMAGLQRIVFIAHWPSDVVFGAAVGIFLGGCFVLPGTVGNYLLNRLEWRIGLGKDLDGLNIPMHAQIESPPDSARRAA